jgi:GAF domain-containing protein
MANLGLEPERLERVSLALTTEPSDHAGSLCVACAKVVGVTGAGVVLMSGGAALGGACVSDAVTEAVEDVQYTLGEGPCMDSYTTRAPVLVPDLDGREMVRWAEFRQGAVRAGVRAAFAFPLLVETVCIGALDLYHDQPGSLSTEQFADAVAVAHVATRTVLGWQAAAVQGSLAPQLEPMPAHRVSFHQATGMVSVQAAVSVGDAQLLLRAYAFAENVPISDVARDVTCGRLRFD